MKIFFDTEFTGLHQRTTLVSIGLASENDKYFYAEFNDYNREEADNWIQKNVLSNLLYRNYSVFSSKTEGSLCYIKNNTFHIKASLELWLSSFGEQLEIWSDCLAYDWVLFNNIWGHAFKIPDYIYYIPFDICTLFQVKGIDSDISREGFVGVEDTTKKHNALYDAKIIKLCYEKLQTIQGDR